MAVVACRWDMVFLVQQQLVAGWMVRRVMLWVLWAVEAAWTAAPSCWWLTAGLMSGLPGWGHLPGWCLPSTSMLSPATLEGARDRDRLRQTLHADGEG